jgi:hypothetical protein
MDYNTIKVTKYSDVIEEKVAAAAIVPGMLIELTSADKVQKHATAEGDAVPMFALEDELQGGEIVDEYDADDPVQCWFPYRGDKVYAMLADGESVSIGDKLASNGDGTLRKHDISSGGAEYPLGIVAIALQTKDLTGSSGEESWTSGYNRILVQSV